jgi:hypothetical protein
MSYVGLLPSAGGKQITMTTKHEAHFHRAIQSMSINKEQPLSDIWGNYGISVLRALCEIRKYVDPQSAECLSAVPGGTKN